MVSVKHLLGTIPRDIRSANEIYSVGVSVQKEDRSTLIPGDKLKL